ncbi:hypothetical protein Cgig2_006557 [Carnegiea gigantea]|uniref:Uncharacterized protein n=1 Tax=Carnegiea gigantea TaxID=171969 RepID=A0A9Q1JTK7_9CARY|nr:hypothetical protein Cgig2_006557 [Carnegiea gigantea]
MSGIFGEQKQSATTPAANQRQVSLGESDKTAGKTLQAVGEAPGDRRPGGPVDDLVCFPAHGAILGSWFGAWPMPLDWERPWQDLLVSTSNLVTETQPSQILLPNPVGKWPLKKSLSTDMEVQITSEYTGLPLQYLSSAGNLCSIAGQRINTVSSREIAKEDQYFSNRTLTNLCGHEAVNLHGNSRGKSSLHEPTAKPVKSLIR